MFTLPATPRHRYSGVARLHDPVHGSLAQRTRVFGVGSFLAFCWFRRLASGEFEVLNDAQERDDGKDSSFVAVTFTFMKVYGFGSERV